MLGGVCGGLGEYLGIDPVIFRVLFVVLFFGETFGFWLYVLLWIIIPEEGKVYQKGSEGLGERVRGMGSDVHQAVSSPHPRAGMIVGIALVIVGGILFLDRLNVAWFTWFDFDYLWPVLLIIAGVALLVRQTREGE
jgi:phage shock protein C